MGKIQKYPIVGKAIKEAIQEKGLTYEKVGEIFGGSASMVSDWANGYKLPDMDKFMELQNLLGIDILELYSREKKLLGGNQYMQIEESLKIGEISSFEEAKKLSVEFISNLDSGYSHSVLFALKMLITALIGLTYFKAEEIITSFEAADDAMEIFFILLEEYLEKDNELDDAFNELSEKLFYEEDNYYDESQKFIFCTVYHWRLFNKTVQNGSNLQSELDIAVAELLLNYSM